MRRRRCGRVAGAASGAPARRGVAGPAEGRWSTRRWSSPCCRRTAWRATAPAGERRPAPRHAGGHPAKGGKHGPVVTPGRALVERARAARLAAGVTRTRCRRRPAPAAAGGGHAPALVDRPGATFDQKVIEREIAPDVLPAIEARLGPLSRGGPTMPPVSLPAPDPSRLARSARAASIVRLFADGSPFVQRASPAGSRRRTTDASPPDPVAPQVLWLT